jgi:hypothetical protein
VGWAQPPSVLRRSLWCWRRLCASWGCVAGGVLSGSGLAYCWVCLSGIGWSQLKPTKSGLRLIQSSGRLGGLPPSAKPPNPFYECQIPGYPGKINCHVPLDRLAAGCQSAMCTSQFGHRGHQRGCEDTPSSVTSLLGRYSPLLSSQSFRLGEPCSTKTLMRVGRQHNRARAVVANGQTI